MRRFSFLTVFLTALTAGFAVAVFLRIRSDQSSLTASTPAPGPAPVEDSRPRLSKPEVRDEVPGDSRRRLSSTAQREKLREQLMHEAQSQATTPPATSSAAGARPVPPPPKPVVQPPRPQPPKATAAPQQAAARPSGGPASQPQPQPAAPKDPNSDTTPPQLLSIEFDPLQVHDGEEARIVMTAIDDLSGIRGISGTITSPTGKALQGFAGVREPDTNRYIGRVVIPKNAEEGLWRVNVVTMSDNASNSTTLSLAQGTLRSGAVLRVLSSESDSKAPTLKSIRVEKRSMRVGEPNPIYIEAADDKSGVNLVSAVFVSPNKRARIGAGCRHGEGDEWICELSLPSCIDCGDWQMEQVTLQDKALNIVTYRMENPIVASIKINIGGDACNNEPPRLLSIVLDPPAVTLAGGVATITVTIVASDVACGIEGASGQYAGPGTGTGSFFPFQQKAGDPMTWVGTINIDPRAPRGTWRITSIQMTDKGHNLRIIYGNDPALANAIFVVR